MRRVSLGLAVAGVLLLCSPPARAAGFLGASWGRSEMHAEVQDISLHDSDVGWKVMGGFGPKYFGLEAFYVDFGRFEDSANGADVDADVTGWDASFFGRLPIKKFEIFGKVGLIYWGVDGSISNGGKSSSSGTDVSWGLGMGWTFGEHFGIRVEYESFKVDPSFVEIQDLTMLSLGIKYQF